MSDVDVFVNLDELDELLGIADDMLEAATSFAQIGKFHSFTTASIYDGSAFKEVDATTWRNHTGFKLLNLHVQIGTNEFNTALEKPYERRIQVKATPWNRKNSDGKYERVPSDWEAIFEPSLFEVTKLNDVTKALKALEGKYVKALDVKQQPTKRQPEPTYNTCKLVAVYDNREEAYADYLANARQTTGNATVETKTYSDEIVTTVRGMVNIPRYKNMSSAELAKEVGGDLTATDIENILKG